jgi:alkylation response protein AidB-like acyl-CoA dehydrogenase
MDMTRKQAEVTFSGVRVPLAGLLGSEGAGWSALQATLTRAVVALAFEQVGGAQRCLEMSVEYAKQRVQFGRPIGSFQAIKHKCADMLVDVESAKSAAYYAGWAVTAGDDEVAIVAPLAKSFCSEAYFRCAAENIQIHGGIGFTWEHDAHLYFKRAKTDELLFGTPAQHRAVLADRLGL